MADLLYNVIFHSPSVKHRKTTKLLQLVQTLFKDSWFISFNMYFRCDVGIAGTKKTWPFGKRTRYTNLPLILSYLNQVNYLKQFPLFG